MPFYHLMKVDAREHDHFMEWYESQGNPSKIIAAANGAAPCEYCGAKFAHHWYPVFANGRLAAFMCELDKPSESRLN